MAFHLFHPVLQLHRHHHYLHSTKSLDNSNHLLGFIGGVDVIVIAQTMRRSGSASCMLRPKNSLSSEDLQRLASWVKAGTPPTTVLTVVDNHKLMRLSPSVVAEASPTSSSSLSPTSSPASPSRRQFMASSNCVVDRLYILSELQAHAHSIRFVCEDVFLFNESTISAASVNDNETIKNDNEDFHLMSRHHSSCSPPLPPSIILYLLWKDSSSAQSFADETITDCVRRCLQVNGDDDDDHAADCGDTCDFRDDEDMNCMCLRRRRRRRRRRPQHQQQRKRIQQQQQQQQQLTRIYVVVDRVSPTQPSAPPLHQQKQPHPKCITAPTVDIDDDDDDDTRNHKQIDINKNSIVDDYDDHNTAILHHRYNCEVTLAKQLARAASTSSYLRERIDGITIGIASDNRATPGLEACMDAVERGAKERRRCAARQVGDGGGGGFFTWLTTPIASALTSAKTIESNSNEEVDDDDDDRYYRMRRKHMLEHIRSKSPERSPVAIVAMHPDDLERIDHHHNAHDCQQQQLNTVTNILQCRVSTEWNGNGECNSFTDRAMGDWREVWYNHRHTDPYVCGGEDGIGRCSSSSSSNSSRYNCRPKVPRILRGDGEGASANNRADGREYDDEHFHEPISTVMVIVFLVVVAAHVWNAYGDVIQSFLLSVCHDH